MLAPVTPNARRSLIEAGLRRLSTFSAFGEAEAKLLQASTPKLRRHAVGAELGCEDRHVLLTAGWACRSRVLASGRRQIFSFLLPGDPIDLCRTDLYRTECLSRAETVSLDEVLGPRGAMDQARIGLRATLEQAEAADHRRQLDHLVRLGSMPAHEAMADLLLEFHDRLEEVGLAEHDRFPLPVFQDVLGGALGLSPAHTSRVFSRLRREALLELKAGWVVLLGPSGIRELVESFRAAASGPKERTTERRVRDEAGARDALGMLPKRKAS